MINLLNCGFFSCPKSRDKGNQDSFVLPTPVGNGFVFAVADGVGSYLGAREAADAATSVIRSIDAKLASDIQSTFTLAKERVDKLAESRHDWVNAATTLSYCFLDDQSLHIGHVGDTRVYVKKSNKLHLVTKDHTQHQELLDDGIFSKRELRDMPGKSTLTAAISRSLALRFQSLKLPINEIVDDNGLINIYIMSDGAHHFWEKRPRLSIETLSKSPKFAASLLRRIERGGPIDDHTLIGASFMITN
ncbi:protein phosphatase 2C domain-containing protein [Citrobacter portucalensis]|uniref:PP2C family protein-serine/threonine phosphatase n=1 Tax=Citrobacter portucalensis TaxID=1639133 RepID=UPI00214D6EA0|nr:protein phosphatase 2C domain-containing protein [Citrobacter portucalensis]MCR3694501.1 protein phosphatase 2C domain-containing protein [Citrobacter portucalensis]